MTTATTATVTDDDLGFLLEAQTALKGLDLRTLPKDARQPVKDARQAVKDALKVLKV